MVSSRVLVASILLVATWGCGEKKESGEKKSGKRPMAEAMEEAAEGGGLIQRVTSGSGSVAPGDFPRGFLSRLDQAGIKHEGWTEAPGAAYGATSCSRGTVEKLDVLLCAFASPAAATAAEEKLLGFATDAVTVVARATGSNVVAVADRKKVDLKGQQITRVLKTLGAQPEADVPPPPPPPP